MDTESVRGTQGEWTGQFSGRGTEANTHIYSIPLHIKNGVQGMPRPIINNQRLSQVADCLDSGHCYELCLRI